MDIEEFKQLLKEQADNNQKRRDATSEAFDAMRKYILQMAKLGYGVEFKTDYKTGNIKVKFSKSSNNPSLWENIKAIFSWK